MAIQVSGTTVIDNSRVLQNVSGLKTVGGTSILGSGNIEAGASTTYHDVGTYVLAAKIMGRTYGGGTAAGSGIRETTLYQYQYSSYGSNTLASNMQFAGGDTLPGTWRQLFNAYIGNSSSNLRGGLWVRVS